MNEPSKPTPVDNWLTAGEAIARSSFTEYRKMTLTPISDITYPPGTKYQTPEGLRAEDEETRCAFDVQGGIYPIRESVFRASYEVAGTAAVPATPPPALDVERLAKAWHIVGQGNDSNWDSCSEQDIEHAEKVAAEYARPHEQGFRDGWTAAGRDPEMLDE